MSTRKFYHGVGAALGPRVAEAEAAAYDFGSLVAPKENKELNCLMIYGLYRV